jgi:hypothetical protein
MVAAYPLEAQISFSSVDYTYGNGAADGRTADDDDDEDYADFPAPNDVTWTASATAAVVLGFTVVRCTITTRRPTKN